MCIRDSRPGLRLFDGDLKGGQVDFAQRTFVYARIDAKTLVFLIICSKMLERCADAAALDAFDQAGGQFAGEIGILREILEIAPAQG